MKALSRVSAVTPQPGDDRSPWQRFQCRLQFFPGYHLNLADLGDVELGANRAGKVDVKAGRPPMPSRKLKGGKSLEVRNRCVQTVRCRCADSRSRSSQYWRMVGPS